MLTSLLLLHAGNIYCARVPNWELPSVDVDVDVDVDVTAANDIILGQTAQGLKALNITAALPVQTGPSSFHQLETALANGSKAPQHPLADASAEEISSPFIHISPAPPIHGLPRLPPVTAVPSLLDATVAARHMLDTCPRGMLDIVDAIDSFQICRHLTLAGLVAALVLLVVLQSTMCNPVKLLVCPNDLLQPALC